MDQADKTTTVLVLGKDDGEPLILRNDLLRDRMMESEEHMCEEIYSKYREAQLNKRYDTKIIPRAKYHKLIRKVAKVIEDWEGDLIDKLRYTIEQQEEELENKEDIIARMGEELKAKDEANEQLQCEIVGKDEKIKQMVEVISSFEKGTNESEIIKKQEEKIQGQLDLLTEQGHQIETWKRKSEELKKQLEELQKQREKWTQKIQQLEQVRDGLRETYDGLKESYDKTMIELRLTQDDMSESQGRKKRRRQIGRRTGKGLELEEPEKSDADGCGNEIGKQPSTSFGRPSYPPTGVFEELGQIMKNLGYREVEGQIKPASTGDEA